MVSITASKLYCQSSVLPGLLRTRDSPRFPLGTRVLGAEFRPEGGERVPARAVEQIKRPWREKADTPARLFPVPWYRPRFSSNVKSARWLGNRRRGLLSVGREIRRSFLHKRPGSLGRLFGSLEKIKGRLAHARYSEKAVGPGVKGVLGKLKGGRAFR